MCNKQPQKQEQQKRDRKDQRELSLGICSAHFTAGRAQLYFYKPAWQLCYLYVHHQVSLILTRVNGQPVLFWEAKREIYLISLNIKYGSSKINRGLYFFFFKEKSSVSVTEFRQSNV